MENLKSDYVSDQLNIDNDKSKALSRNTSIRSLLESVIIQDTCKTDENVKIGIFNSNSFYYNLLLYISFSINTSHIFYTNAVNLTLITMFIANLINEVLNVLLIDIILKKVKYFSTFSVLIQNKLGFLASVLFDILSIMWLIFNVFITAKSFLYFGTIKEMWNKLTNPLNIFYSFLFSLIYGVYCWFSKPIFFTINFMIKMFCIIILLILLIILASYYKFDLGQSITDNTTRDLVEIINITSFGIRNFFAVGWLICTYRYIYPNEENFTFYSSFTITLLYILFLVIKPCCLNNYITNKDFKDNYLYCDEAINPFWNKLIITIVKIEDLSSLFFIGYIFRKNVIRKSIGDWFISGKIGPTIYSLFISIFTFVGIYIPIDKVKLIIISNGLIGIILNYFYPSKNLKI